MSDLLFLLRWLMHARGRCSITIEPQWDSKWRCHAHRFVKANDGSSRADLTFHYHSEGRTPLRALRNLAKVIQEAEA